MNKEMFINELTKRLNYSKEKCIKINEVLEDNFIIGKKNKEKIINQIIEALNIDYNKANEVYEVSMDILGSELKNKIKHPFDL